MTADEQGALRRVAILVAQRAAPAEIFAAAASEVGVLVHADVVHLARYEHEGVAVALAGWAREGETLPAGTSAPYRGRNVLAEVLRTGRPVRIDDYGAGTFGEAAERVRSLGLRAAVGAPVIVDSRVWGALVATSKTGPLPPGAEERIAAIAELVAAALTNAAAQDQWRRLTHEPAALERVASLVARAVPADELFAAVAAEAGTLTGTDAAAVVRYDDDRHVTTLATWSAVRTRPEPGRRWALHDGDLWTEIQRYGTSRAQPSRSGDPPAPLGNGHSVGCPIIVAGEVWGALTVHAETPSPSDAESRLSSFAELVAAAIANDRARKEARRLAEEQAALRRVATLVARGASPKDVFDTVVEELGRLLDVGSTGLVRFDDDEMATLLAGWGRLGEAVPVGARLPLGGTNVISQIARTGAPARLDSYSAAGSGHIADQARRLDTRAAAGGPIVVAGRLWGAMIAAALEGGRLPPDSEPRLEQFTELIGTAIANAEARTELARFADEDAALRRVATLVAEESPPAVLFAKVAEEAAKVLGRQVESAILRYEPDDTATVVAVWGDRAKRGTPVGARMPVDGSGASARVLREQRPVRVDDYAAATGAIADQARSPGIRSAIGSPIVVQGRLWGAMVVANYEDEPLPAGTEGRVSQFTQLVSTAIVNAEARAELQRLADQQAALRRVATLVAQAAAPTDVFDAVIVEVAQILRAAQVGMMRAESGDEITIVAQRGQDPAVVHVGLRLPLAGDSVTTRVMRTGRPARINRYDERSGAIAEIARRSNVNATVGTPIMVEGRLWGVITASWDGRDVPHADAEERLAEFAGLVAAAIGNAHSRDELTASRARVLTAGDQARRQVVRDLHDGAQQRLVHTIVALKLARRAFAGGDGDQMDALLAQALSHAEQGNDELRELAHGILPSVLTRGGLRDGVDSLVARLDLPVHVDVAGSRLPRQIEASAYFIVAEALTNVSKHAQATRVEVIAAVEGGRLRLEVRDDGIGGADPEGAGLLGLGDRAAVLGGRLRVESPRGAGTVVTAELPVPD